MRASDLIGSRIVDEAGHPIGLLRDLRVTVDDGDSTGFPIAGLIVSEPGPFAAAAHAWGYAEGRARGPAPLRRLFMPAFERSLFVPVDRVLDWGPGVVRVSGRAHDLPSLAECSG